MMQSFTFKYPWVLLNLLWLFPWFLLASKIWRAKRFILHSSICSLKKLEAHPQKIPLLLRMFALASFIIALARPQGVSDIINHEVNGIDIMLAIDLSSSMLATDFSVGKSRKLTRIQAAKNVIEDFVQQRKNDRIGLVSFARYPYLVSPLTLNHDWLLKNLERLNAGLIEDGTAIGSAVTMCINRLKELTAKTRLVILLTDGINNFGDVTPALAAEVAKSFQTKVYAIMVGNDQIFPADQETLAQMAETTGGRFYRAYDLKSLQEIYQEIDRLEKIKIEDETFKAYYEFFVYCLVAACCFLFIEFLLRNFRYRVVS